jgi:hypothetical protein
MEQKSYEIIENLVNRSNYIAASNRKAFTTNQRYKKLQDKIAQDNSDLTR